MRRPRLNPIQHPPRDLRRWLRAIHKKALRFLRAIDRLQEVLNSDVRDALEDEDGVDEVLRFGTGLTLSDFDFLRARVEKIADETGRLEGNFDIGTLGEGLRWTGSTLTHLLGDYGEVSSVQSLAERRVDYYDPDALYYYRDELPENTEALLARFDKSFTAFVVGLPKSLRELERSLAEWEALSQRNWRGGESVPPESDPVETLYHASVNARVLYEEGFQMEVPEDGGIGGSQSARGDQKGVSFTSDLYIAKEIAATLKQIVALLQGSWRLSSFLRQLRESGHYEEVVRQYKADNRPFPPESDADVYELFNKYLWFGDARFNPVFFGAPKKMAAVLKKARLKDIGVVAASVDMEDPDIYYLRAMHEYRVPPRAILEVEKLIK